MKSATASAAPSPTAHGSNPSIPPPQNALLTEALHRLPRTRSGPPPLLTAVETLRAEILLPLGRPPDALAALDLAPDDPEARLLRPRVLAALGQLDQAQTAIEQATSNPTDRAALTVLTHLAHRAASKDPATRATAALAALDAAESLPSSQNPRARQALITLAEALDPPPTTLRPPHGQTLAAGLTLRGRDEAAADALLKSAQTPALPAETTDPLHYQAAALLLRAGSLSRVATAAAPILDRPDPGPYGPQTALILALARELAADRNPTAANGAAAQQALRKVIELDPNAPPAHEARYRLGLSLKGFAPLAEVHTLWAAIPPSQPRWLDAALATSSSQRDQLEATGFKPPKQDVNHLDSYLDSIHRLAADPSTLAEIELEQVRLNLSPVVRDVETARQRLRRLESGPLLPDQRHRIAGFHMVLEAHAGRYVEAEEQAAALARSPISDTSLVAIALLIDRLAAHAATEQQGRRLGTILIQLTEKRMTSPARSIPGWMLALLEARGQAYRGLPSLSRDHLAILRKNPSLPFSPDLERLLAESLMLAEDPEAAQAILRAVIQKARPGQPLWYEARLELAVSYLQSGDSTQARRVVEATRLLNPTAPDPLLQLRMEQLARRLGPTPGPAQF